jgi:GT2 family glycosyltransferase
MIGLVCGEIGRFSDVIPSLIGLHKPPGTVFFKTSTLGPAAGFNIIGQHFISDPTLEWLFLTNDDNLCPSDTLPRLWAHIERGDADAVSGLYFGRIQPFEPILFDSVEWRDGRRWYTRHLMSDGESGLIPAVVVGDGCLMVRRRVMEAINQPWWEYGETLTDACDHDVVFSRKVREAGFKLACDLDLTVGHIATIVVQPHRQPDGKWKVHLRQEQRVIGLDAAHPDIYKHLEGIKL